MPLHLPLYPMDEQETQWMRDPEWNFAHRVTIDGKILCQPFRRWMPLPPRATESDPRCSGCAAVVGQSVL